MTASQKYMVIEHFRDGAYDAVYKRFHARGRLLPDGLTYLDSWVSADRTTCYQLMETADPALFPVWFKRWEDLVSFDLIPLQDR